MSNHLVGTVYATVIDEVINSSRIDFEEAGVNASTLDDLKKVWQQKLSDLKVAHFPWDPPVEQPNIQQQMGRPPQGQPHIKPDPTQYPHMQNGGIRIKTEPGMDHQQQMYQHQVQQQQPPQIQGNPTHDPHLAAMRAQQNIQQKFGNAPQLQARPVGGLVLPGMNPGPQQPQHHPQQYQQHPQQHPQQHMQHPQQHQQLPQMQPQQRPLQQQPPPQQQQQQQQQQQRPGGIPQHDGADDEDVVPVEGYGNFTREEADRILLRRINNAERESIAATESLAAALRDMNVKSSKGKGKATSASAKRLRRRARKMDAYEAALDPNSSYPYPSESSSIVAPAAPRIPQGDANEDDDEHDEDAINSDLDDSDDDVIDNDDDEEPPQIMLCMYDKVQRTKNKWKCVLKDGVLTINGQEYVFHKANGEYEW